MNLASLLDPELILPNLSAATQAKAFEEMAAAIAPKLKLDAKVLVDALMDREKTRSTALEKTGVAIPHARINGATEFGLLYAASKSGIDFKAEDGKPSHLFFLIVGPENNPGEYLRLLARVARVSHGDKFRARLIQATTKQSILDIISDEEAKG